MKTTKSPIVYKMAFYYENMLFTFRDAKRVFVSRTENGYILETRDRKNNVTGIIKLNN
jgi:hypothetical protein